MATWSHLMVAERHVISRRVAHVMTRAQAYVGSVPYLARCFCRSVKVWAWSDMTEVIPESWDIGD